MLVRRLSPQTVLGFCTPTLLLSLRRHVWTAFLFTRADFKTILFPVTLMACVWAPVHSWKTLVHGVFWIWAHLLQVNVSNQVHGRHEDAVNKPWRPIPSGRVSHSQGLVLRWFLFVACVSLSTAYGVAGTSVTMTLISTLHDNIGLDHNWFLKNVCNALGYLLFELGATQIMGRSDKLDPIATLSLAFSYLIILTTIHAQDFADVHGDLRSGRQTFPIVSPEVSRIFSLLALPAWSIFLSFVWKIGPLSYLLFCGCGTYVGWRYYQFRLVEDDERSYVLYNTWILISHILPIHKRWRLLAI